MSILQGAGHSCDWLQGTVSQHLREYFSVRRRALDKKGGSVSMECTYLKLNVLLQCRTSQNRYYASVHCILDDFQVSGSVWGL